jgi:hypothetical protein
MWRRFPVRAARLRGIPAGLRSGQPRGANQSSGDRRFVVLYPAFDAAVGISSGVIVHSLGTLAPDQHASVEQGLQALFWGPVTGLMAIVASASWLVALIAAAWALRQAGAPRPVVAARAVGLLLGIAHIRPIGPLACLSFLIAAAWIELRWDKRQSA